MKKEVIAILLISVLLISSCSVVNPRMSPGIKLVPTDQARTNLEPVQISNEQPLAQENPSSGKITYYVPSPTTGNVFATIDGDTHEINYYLKDRLGSTSLVIDGDVKVAGKIPEKEEIKRWIGEIKK